ncbi:hypothetical protein ACQ4PT_053662 [Festuca glaucescens]
MAEGRKFEYPDNMTDDEIARLGVLVSENDRPVQPPLPRAATWSNLVLDEILEMLGCLRDQKVHVYWLAPGKTLKDGLLPIVTFADMNEMRNATTVDNTLVIFVDHTNFLRTIRAEVVRINVARAAPSGARQAPSGARPAASVATEAPSGGRQDPSGARPAASVATAAPSGGRQAPSEDGDDDLFIDNVDNNVNDNNERAVFVENEDEDALDDRDLNLVDDERQLLKFKEFNSEIGMDSPVFKIGMKFADIEEVRQAVNAYSIRNRVKIRKIKNNRSRIHAICDEGCPWFLKVGTDIQRSGGFVITAYEDEHRCERVYELRALTTRFLCKKFIDEFRDN